MVFPLSNLHISAFNEMQEHYLLQKGNFLLLKSSTGTGKTIAFLAKLHELIEGNTTEHICIISPTRELAAQIGLVCQKAFPNLLQITCYGGKSMQNETAQFKNNPSLVISTPGRLTDHIDRETEGLVPFQHFILDEYDKCVDMGFQEQIEHILSYNQELKSIQLSSATDATSLPSFLSKFPFLMVDFGTTKLKLTYHLLNCTEEDKLHQTALLINELQTQKTIVFLNHREAANRLSAHLDEYGIKNVVYHGAVEQDDRLKNLFLFQSGCVHVLICTDLASRGLDIPEVKNIVHYQFPKEKSEFIHRNGRTARNLHDGDIYIIKTPIDNFDHFISDISTNALTLPEKFSDVNPTLNRCFWIGLGKFNKIRKVDFVGFLTQSLSIENTDIQGFLVLPRYSLVSLTMKGGKKIDSLKDGKIVVKKLKSSIKKFSY